MNFVIRLQELERLMKMKRKKVTLEDVRKYTGDYDETHGILAMIDVDDMGFCKDGVTRWYHFDMDGVPCVYYKY